jgi:hypothetical protein
LCGLGGGRGSVSRVVHRGARGRIGEIDRDRMGIIGAQ